MLTQMIRSRIETILPRSTGALARLGALYRVAVDRLVPRGVARRRFWRAFFDGEIAGLVEGEQRARRAPRRDAPAEERRRPRRASSRSSPPVRARPIC